MKRNWRFGALLVLFGFWGCSGPPAPPGLDAILDEEIPKLMDVAEVPGLSIAVIRDGVIFYAGAFGVRSTETGEPIDTDTIFEAASLTKTLTAAAALKLVEEGKLDLDTPLCEYLPYPKLAGDERYQKITARLVLTHTTGLPNWGNRLIREPGELYAYSGEGFLYLGRTIEKISGQGLGDFARENIFTPLGMTRTSYVWTEDYAANGAQGHDRHGVAQALRQRDEANGGASLITTPTDYARYVCALLNGEVLKPETIAQMLSPQVHATKWGKTDLDEHISWGWGWGIQPGVNGNGFWHWGNNGDLRGYTVAYGDKNEGLVFFSNSENAFGLAEPLVALITDETQWSMQWLDWERYDDPQRVARRSVEKAFLEQGAEAGMTRLAEVKQQYPDLFDLGEMGQTAQLLLDQRKFEEAAALFSRMVELEPKRMQAWEGLGLVEMEQKHFKEAIQAYEKALAINPNRRMAKTAVPWIRELMAAEGKTVDVPASLLEKYAGDYGPRKITLREGRLFYQREGRPEYRLKALNRSTFLLEGYLRFRLQFVTNSQGEVTSVSGLYIEGRTDMNKRSEESRP
jgi:CubicO group peptidase (beta-lactamase class C family)